VPATSTIRPTRRVFVLQGSAAAKSWYGGRFYSTLGHKYLLSDTPKKLLNQTAVAKVTANFIGVHFFDLQFHVHDVLSAFTR